MERLIDLLDDNIVMNLNNVDFRRNDDTAAISQCLENELNIEDEFKVRYVGRDDVIVDVKRHVFFSPVEIVDVVVEFEVMRHRADGAGRLDEFRGEQITADNLDEFMMGAMGRASMMISNITASFGPDPIVTPPMFLAPEGEGMILM